MDINLIPPSELGKGSNIKLNVCEHEVDMYWKVAIEVLEVIEENNRKGEPTVMVVPYGPIGPYARMAELVNKYRISLKNCVFINMDEYLTDDCKYIDYNHPLSFRGGMDRTFYSKVDEELNVLPENRIFPDPENTGRVLEIIKEYGKLDMVFGGVGINGHYAFNEPPEKDSPKTADEFAELGTRVLPISRETKTINAYGYQRGDLKGMCEWCITIGMKQILSSKKIYIALNRPWQNGPFKHAVWDEPTAEIPASLLRRCKKLTYCGTEEIMLQKRIK